MAIVSNQIESGSRLNQIAYAPALFFFTDQIWFSPFFFALLSCVLNSNVKEKRPWVRLESTLMENWRGGRHFFDDGILCLSTLLLFSSVRVPLSPFSTSSCVCSTVLSSYIRVQLFNSNISFNNFNSLVTLTSFSFFLFVRVFFFFFPWMFNEARTVRDRSSSRSVSSSISFSNRWQQYTRRWEHYSIFDVDI